MFLQIARFEVRYLLRNPLLWLTAAAVFLLPFASLALGLQLEEDIRVFKNSAYEVISKYRIVSCLFMFVTTVFVSNIVLRDDETGFAPILRSTGIDKLDYLFGRFAGALVVVALCLALVTPGIVVGSWMPGAELIGPNRLNDHLYGFFLIALPNVIITASIFFALATVTRSMTATYVGLVMFLGTYFTVLSAVGAGSDLAGLTALLDPFSGRAFENVVRYWTPPERNVQLPAFTGALLLNRIIWLTISAAFLTLAYWSFDFASSGRSRGARRRKRAEQLAAIPGDDQAPSLQARRPLPEPCYGPKAKWALLKQCLRFEASQVLKSPAFLILLLYTIFLSQFLLIGDRSAGDSPTYPLATNLIPRLQEVFLVIPLAIIIIYTGELTWRERDRRMHEIMDAAPQPDWAYLIPKTLAVGLVLFLLYAASVAAAIAVQLAEGFPRLDLAAYALLFLAPMTWDALLVIALATVVQVLCPHKYLGWGIMVLWGVARFAGVMPHDNMLNYAGIPPIPLSDMDGGSSFWEAAWLFRVYWGACAALLLVLAHVLWRRGTASHLMPRLRSAPSRLSGPSRLVAGGALATFAATGALAFYNTNVLNRCETQVSVDEYLARYEKAYRRYADLSQPSIVHMRIAIELYPEVRRAEVAGSYTIANLSDRPIDTMHVRMDDRALALTRIAVPGATLVHHDRAHSYRIYRFARPMAPGERRRVTFATERWHRGFANGAPDVTIAENGTFLTAKDLLPAIGVHTQPLVINAAVRKRFGLPPARRAPLENLAAARNPADGQSWSTADITLSTRADQTPVAPGRRIADTVRGDRRIARFVSDSPIRTAFAVQSAHYAVKRVRADGVDFEVFYHPMHAWNVDRMLSAMRTSLAYYRAQFGPYQFPQIRIVEFPGYGRNFAQAFANTIPYSETVGFDADLRTAGAVDEITPMTAHELAHQYWAHQVSPAATEGSLVLSETLAQYSAMMVLKRTLGREQANLKLKDQLDSYLAFRAWSKQAEVPLARAETQNYVIYNKGALVMNLMAERLGEDAVNRALRKLLHRYRFKGAPYSRSADLVNALRDEARTPEDQALITDAFERITLYDLKVDKPDAYRRSDGRWVVRVPVDAHKLYVDTRGGENEAPLSDTIEVGLFGSQRGKTTDEGSVAVLKRQIRSGRQVLTFVVDRKPSYAAIDPFNLYIDRDLANNGAAVTLGG